MSVVSPQPRQSELVRQLHLQLPRVLSLLGLGLMIVGTIATIGFVATDSSCNSVTNPALVYGGQVAGSPSTSSFCGHRHGFLTISFLTLVAGAILLLIGTMVLPTLRSRDARLAEQAAHNQALVETRAAAQAQSDPQGE